MKIAICVKYVPVDSKVQVDPATHALVRGSGAGEINPSDRYAVEMARRLKGDGDTLGTAKVLAAALEHYGPYDVVLMGSASNDGATGQVGPMTAEMLGMPDVTDAVDCQIAGGRASVAKKAGDALLALEAALPVLVTVPFGANAPELPTLRHQVAANQHPIVEVTAADLGVDPATVGQAGALSVVTDTMQVVQKKQAVTLTGTVDDMAKKLADRVDGQLKALQQGGGEHV